MRFDSRKLWIDVGRQLKRKFTRKLAKRRDLADQLSILQRAWGLPTRQDTIQPATLSQQKDMRNHAYAEEQNALEIYSQQVNLRCLPIIPSYDEQRIRSLGTSPIGDGGERLQQLSPSFCNGTYISRAIRASRLRCNLDQKADHFVFTIWVHHAQCRRIRG